MDKDCCTCELDEMCGWKFRDDRGYCDKWREDEREQGKTCRTDNEE